MAAPITHIILADKLYQKLFSDKNQTDFYIGACLPDIRYIDPDVSRSQTHRPVGNINEIFNETDPLIAGMKFHQLTDSHRDRFINQYPAVFTKYEQLFFIGGAMKLLEDQILYNKITDWSRIIHIFQTDFSRPVPAGLSTDRIKQFNQILINYFLRPPDPASRLELLLAFGFSTDEITRAEDSLIVLQTDPAVTATIENMYNNIEEIIFV